MFLKKILKEQLHSSDINISQLSRATKVPRQTIDNWLTSQDPRNLSQVKKVADYFEIRGLEAT